MNTQHVRYPVPQRQPRRRRSRRYREVAVDHIRPRGADQRLATAQARRIITQQRRQAARGACPAAEYGNAMDVDAVADFMTRQILERGGHDGDVMPLRQFLRDLLVDHPAPATERRALVVEHQEVHHATDAPAMTSGAWTVHRGKRACTEATSRSTRASSQPSSAAMRPAASRSAAAPG